VPWWFIGSRDERYAHTVVARIASESKSARVTLVEGTSHASDILSPHFVLNAEIADWFAGRLAPLAAPRLWGGLPPGGLAVGFRRQVVASTVIDVWYPALPAASTSTPIAFGEYVRLSDDLRGAAPGVHSSPAAIERTLAVAITGDPAGVAPALLQELAGAPMAGRRDAPVAPGRFPVLLWTPRYGTTVAQSILSEFLASHGFVVAFARPAAANAKLPHELDTSDAKVRELRARVDDMAVALSALEHHASVDATRIGIVAWSYTGEFATAFQRLEPRVSFVAGLSTTLVSDWVFQDPAVLAGLDTRRLGAVYAIFTESRERVLAHPPLPEGRAYLIELPGLRHGNFNALEGFIPSLLAIPRVQRWSSSGAAGVTGYEALATMLLRLVRHHVAEHSPRRLVPLVLRSGLPPGAVVVHPVN
jgi:hypothetical protein